jgi:hypothetical protein
MSEQARGMNTTEPIRPASAPRSAPESPTVGEIVAETVPLADVIAGFGPPVLALAGPWLFFALLLAGPFALLVTLVLLLIAAALLVVLAGAILASPYLLVRHLRRLRTGHGSVSSPAVQLVSAEPQRARA